MKIDEVRIYAEVLEQGLDFKKYILKYLPKVLVKNIYSKKKNGEFNKTDSLTDRIRRVKDIDVLITAVSENNEYPLLIVE